MKLYDCLLRAAEEEPDRIALEFYGMKVSYGELAQSARAIAAGLAAQGIRPGDTVGVMLPNHPHFPAIHYAIMMAGGIFVPLNVMLRASEVRYVAEDSKLRAIITFELFAREVLEGVRGLADPPKVFVIGDPVEGMLPFDTLLQPDPTFKPYPGTGNDHVCTLYTSGTTGAPKGAMITDENILRNLEMVDDIFESTSDERVLCVLPMFHAFALQGIVNASIRNRSTVVVQTRFELDPVVDALSNQGITRFLGVPTMFFYLLKHPRVAELRFPALKTCICGGAPMPVEVLQQFEKIFGVPIYEGFGMTETTVSVSINRPGQRKVGSIGLPFDAVEIKIVDEEDREVPCGEIGEVVVRAPNVMLGYWNKPEATAEALRGGWLHTGDLGRKDEDGFFYIVDRKKDMIIKGGFNIYPREIEEVLYQIPQVAEAAVIGMPDEALGEQVHAVVSLKPGQECDVDTLRKHVEGTLAKFKWPQEYRILNELPKGPTGKLLKREIKQHWGN